jgi:hypothetical protein
VVAVAADSVPLAAVAAPVVAPVVAVATPLAADLVPVPVHPAVPARAHPDAAVPAVVRVADPEVSVDPAADVVVPADLRSVGARSVVATAPSSNRLRSDSLRLTHPFPKGRSSSPGEARSRSTHPS